MKPTRDPAQALRWMAGGVAMLGLGYAALAAAAWYRYGRGAPAGPGERDCLLDRWMPEFEVAERHEIRVSAPAAITLAAAADMDLRQSAIIRGIFRARELLLGAEPGPESHHAGLLAQMTALGWRVVAEEPGREIVMGAVTQPWLPDVVFRGLTPEAFRAFREPGYVKIAWTLRADPAGGVASIFRTETRVIATDPAARARFRWYWARFSPGIILIRRLTLGLVRAEAERRARCARRGARTIRAAR